jgi:hypothetical protein
MSQQVVSTHYGCDSIAAPSFAFQKVAGECPDSVFDIQLVAVGKLLYHQYVAVVVQVTLYWWMFI